jgi:hypothetical protein
MTLATSCDTSEGVTLGPRSGLPRPTIRRISWPASGGTSGISANTEPTDYTERGFSELRVSVLSVVQGVPMGVLFV